MNKLLKSCAYLLIFVLCFHQSEQKVAKALKIGFQVFEKAISIFKTGLSIADYFDKSEPDSGLTVEDLQKLRNDIIQQVEHMLQISENNIILALTLQEEVGRLKHIVSVVRSSLADLDYYLKAENEPEKLKYKELFLKRFEEHDVVVEIRKLPVLLSDNVPELSKPMKYLILDTTNCNMTSIIEFEQFYAKLISSAVTLQLVYTEISDLNLDYVQAYWDNMIDNVQNTFDEMENVCIDKFEVSVSKEILEDIPPKDLQKNNKERYNWKWNDVFEYQPFTTNEWHYVISLPDKREQHLFMNGRSGDRNRIIVFGDKNTTVRWNRETVQVLLKMNAGQFQVAAKGPNAAKDLGQAIGTFVNKISYIYKRIIVFYYELPNIKVFIDRPLSPVACVHVHAADKVGNYYACVYPEIWNDFASYLNAYTEFEVNIVTVAAAALSAHANLHMLIMTATFACIHVV